MPTVKTLNQTHPDYDCDYLCDQKALYAGGKLFQSRIDRFLPKNEAESQQQYDKRKKATPYRSYTGPIIDKFAAMLLAAPPSASVVTKTAEGATQEEPPKYYQDFRADCDGRGTDLSEFFRETFTDGQVKKVTFFSVLPPVGVDQLSGISKQEYEERKLGNVKLRELETEEVINWDIDDTGNLNWLVYHECRSIQSSPLAERNQIQETWTIFDAEKVETYGLTYAVDKRPKDEDEVPLIASLQHGLKEIPVVAFVVPEGLAIGNRLYSAQLEHFRLSAAQSWSLKMSCYAMPIFILQEDNQAPAMGAGRSVRLNIDEEVNWLAPPTGHLDALSKAIAESREEMYRIVHQMAEGANETAQKSGKSALSKLQDSKSTSVILESYSKLLRDVIQKTYRLVSKLRGEKIDWHISGLDEFETLDIDSPFAAITEAESIGMPSETFQKEVRIKVVDALMPNLDESTRSQIIEELEDGIKQKFEDAENESAAKAALAHSLTETDEDRDAESETGTERPAQANGDKNGGRPVVAKAKAPARKAPKARNASERSAN